MDIVGDIDKELARDPHGRLAGDLVAKILCNCSKNIEKW
jgi:hypothetical protein